MVGNRLSCVPFPNLCLEHCKSTISQRPKDLITTTTITNKETTQNSDHRRQYHPLYIYIVNCIWTMPTNAVHRNCEFFLENEIDHERERERKRRSRLPLATLEFFFLTKGPRCSPRTFSTGQQQAIRPNQRRNRTLGNETDERTTKWVLLFHGSWRQFRICSVERWCTKMSTWLLTFSPSLLSSSFLSSRRPQDIQNSPSTIRKGTFGRRASTGGRVRTPLQARDLACPVCTCQATKVCPYPADIGPQGPQKDLRGSCSVASHVPIRTVEGWWTRTRCRASADNPEAVGTPSSNESLQTRTCQIDPPCTCLDQATSHPRRKSTC